jgi:hypothetical protein
MEVTGWNPGVLWMIQHTRQTTQNDRLPHVESGYAKHY